MQAVQQLDSQSTKVNVSGLLCILSLTYVLPAVSAFLSLLLAFVDIDQSLLLLFHIPSTLLFLWLALSHHFLRHVSF